MGFIEIVKRKPAFTIDPDEKVYISARDLSVALENLFNDNSQNPDTGNMVFDEEKFFLRLGFKTKIIK